jgi:hypothetical protein
MHWPQQRAYRMYRTQSKYSFQCTTAQKRPASSIKNERTLASYKIEFVADYGSIIHPTP